MAAPPSGSPKLNLLSLPISGRTPLSPGLDSALSSGRSTPTGWRGADTHTSNALSADPKWKKYTSLVDKSLASFDSVKEWADFISFLSRLLRTLQANPSFDEIPRKLVVAKRLAQCLTPALPSGVHQRALDVYGHILKTIKPEGLRRDLLIWSSGLFPFFQYASTSAKPQLLDLYEKFYLPLQDGLRPATKALILALLPGLEEEAGEFFDKVMYFLDYLSSTVSSPFFLQNVWLILISTPTARPTALTYLARRMPKLGPEDDITQIVGADVGLMVRAFASCLDDNVVLVQRGTLDLLVTTLRLDGAASSSHTSHSDRLMLMRATSSVVLRRDLSLSRRLYTWLSGTGETPEAQVSFLKEHGLKLLRESLAIGMTSEDEVERLKSYKIFNSLLDKWEIGFPLSEVLVLDMLPSFRHVDLSSQQETLSVACSILYESLDPFVIWQQLFLAVRSDFDQAQSMGENLDLLDYVLRSLPLRDEEVLHFHLPVLFASCLSLLRKRGLTSSSSSKHNIRALNTLSHILSSIPSSVFASKADNSPLASSDSSSDDPLSHAIALYADRSDSSSAASAEYPGFAGLPLLKASLDTLLDMSKGVARSVEGGGPELVATLRLVEQLLGKTASVRPESVSLRWEPSCWVGEMIKVASQTHNFIVLQQIIATSLELASVDALQPPIALMEASALESLMRATLSFLSESESLHHLDAVHVVWDLDRISSRTALQSTLFADLSGSAAQPKRRALSALGVLWRHENLSEFPGDLEKEAVFHVLEALSSKSVAIRRTGESWIRANVDSQIRFISPILTTLLEPLGSRKSASSTHNGRDFDELQYTSSFDARAVAAVLERLGALQRFLGQSLHRSLRSTLFVRDANPKSQVRSRDAHLDFSDGLFLDALVEILLIFLQTEAPQTLTGEWIEDLPALQLNAALILHALLIEPNTPVVTLQIAQAGIFNKLFSDIQHGLLDLQPSLLLILHDIIRLADRAPSSPESSEAASRTSASSRAEKASPQTALEPLNSDKSAAFLLQMVIDGISAQTNLPVLSEWIDFILRTTPLLQGPLKGILIPLADSLVGRVTFVGDSLRAALQDAMTPDNSPARLPIDLQVVSHLKALEQVTTLVLQSSSEKISSAQNSKTGTDTSSGLRSYMSGVFGADGESFDGSADFNNLDLTPGTRTLFKTVRSLHSLWDATSDSERSETSGGLRALTSKTQDRVQEVFRHLYGLKPLDVVQDLAELWFGLSLKNDTSFELLDGLVSSSQASVAVIVQILSARAPTGNEKGPQRGSPLLDERDLVMFDFLEAYIARLDAPLAVQVWSSVLGFARDVGLTSSDLSFRSFVYPTLRSVFVLADKVATTSALQDRRLRRELQECFSRLVDMVATVAGRRYDASTSAIKGRSSRPTTAKSSSTAQVTYPNIAVFISESVMPNLRRFLVDNERVVAACNVVNLQMVVPALRSKANPASADPLTLGILQQITSVAGTIKGWRNLIGDPFTDPKFFSMSPSAGKAWEPLVIALLDAEKDRLVELIARISAPPSAGLFTSRDAEMTLRCLCIRRLTFVLLSAPKNHFLLHLPTIQQNLVEVLRTTGLAASVHAEVYLCLRVLICRMGANVLGNLWPVILTELLRVFEQALETLPADESDALTLVLAAVKFLDLLLILQLEDFQIHQWMFVADTAIDQTLDWEPDGLLDRLSSILSESPSLARTTYPPLDLPPPSHSPLRRPLLAFVIRLSSITQLGPFLAQASLTAFEANYVCTGVDWAAVERGFRREVFEG